jgi:hypothetical protein
MAQRILNEEERCETPNTAEVDPPVS